MQEGLKMTNTLHQEHKEKNTMRRDLHQHVTDTIIGQLEAGTVPWQKPWKDGEGYSFALPFNATTGKKYRGINILLLWSSAINQEFLSSEWGTFKQWNQWDETIRKGEKGSLIVYYDTIEKEEDGELKKIPFLKSSVVFNRCQLASFDPEKKEEGSKAISLIDRIEKVDEFVTNTNATVLHKGTRACYIPSTDEIHMPHPEAFIGTDKCTPTESYYSTLFHELTHMTGSPNRLDRAKGKKFGDQKYAAEELIAELGAAFLCAEFDITSPEKSDHASYIAHWLQVLKDNKKLIIPAASEASKAVEYLQGLQPN